MIELQCRDGDLAVVTRDDPGLEANVGRLLWVYGPVRQDAELGPVWETVPATNEPMAYLAKDGSVRFDREVGPIYHPDAWMTPVSMAEFAGRRPPRVVDAVPLTREWLEAVAAMSENVYLELPRKNAPATPRLTGRQLRARLRTQVCIPVEEDYGYATWLWFPGRSLSATVHWWVQEGTPELIGKVFGPADQAAYDFHQELSNDRRLPWVFADGQWNTYMALPARHGINVIPRFTRGTIEASYCGAVKSTRKRKDGSVFRWVSDWDCHRANWRLSQQVAEVSKPERYLEALHLALGQKQSPLPTLHG